MSLFFFPEFHYFLFWKLNMSAKELENKVCSVMKYGETLGATTHALGRRDTNQYYNKQYDCHIVYFCSILL